MVITPKTAIIQFQWEVFPYVWLLIAGLILIFGIVAAIYICESWSKLVDVLCPFLLPGAVERCNDSRILRLYRYKAYKERMARMCITPRYDPVFVEPNLKEYETQVSDG